MCGVWLKVPGKERIKGSAEAPWPGGDPWGRGTPLEIQLRFLLFLFYTNLTWNYFLLFVDSCNPIRVGQSS